MRIILDLDKGHLITSASLQQPVTSLRFIRSSAEPLVVQTARQGAIVDLGAPTITFLLKTVGQYEQSPALVLTTAFTKTGTGTAAEWGATLNFITTALNALFVHDDNATNDVAQVACMGELVVSSGGNLYRSGEIAVTIRNNVYQGDEVEPAAAPDGSSYLVTGGNGHIRPELGVTNEATLTALTTNGIPRPVLIATLIADNARLWLLRDEVGTESTDYAAGIVKPTDYDSEDNAGILEAYL